MPREAPDPRFYGEVHDLNLEFLQLIRTSRRTDAPLFGLDSSVIDGVIRLSPAQLDAAAGVPCLLATIAQREHSRTYPFVGEPIDPAERHWLEATRVFRASLLTYVWQMARRDPLLAGLCSGQADGWAARLRQMGYRELRQLCDSAEHGLRARFGENRRFWPDLLSATGSGDSRRIHLAHMTGIQLSLRGRAGRLAPVTVG